MNGGDSHYNMRVIGVYFSVEIDIKSYNYSFISGF